MVIVEMIQIIYAVVSSFLYEMLKILPIYEQLSSIKEQLISIATGIPIVVVTIISFISTALTIFIKASKR